MGFGRSIKTIEADSELILSTDYYMHRAIMQAIQSPFKSLENNTPEEGLKVVRLSGFLVEKFAKSNGVISTKKDLDKLHEFLKQEEASLKKENPEIDENTLKTMLAYSKISWVLEQVENSKSSKTKYEV